MKNWLCCVLVAIGLVAGPAGAGSAEDAQALEAQAKRFWAAEVAQDWGAVYDLLPPMEQKAGTRDEYVAWRKQLGLVNYPAAEIGEVAVSGDLGWVRVKYEYQMAKYPDVPPRQAEMWDVWRNVDGWRPVAKKERDAWPKWPPSRRPAAEEATLASRSQALWQTQVAQDWNGYYGFLPPEFRARMTLEEFMRGKAKNYYSSPRVEWSEVIGEKGRVRVNVLVKSTDPAVSKMEPEPKVVIEKWVKADGNWYLDVDLPPDPKDKIAEKKAP